MTINSAINAGGGTTTTVLHGNATGAPTYGQIVNADITNTTIDLTSKVTGTLPIGNGGTGNTSYSPNGIVFFNSPQLTTSSSITYDRVQGIMSVIHGSSANPYLSVASTLTGSANNVSVRIIRGDTPNGYSQLQFFTGATSEWVIGTQANSTANFYFVSTAFGTVLTLTQTSGLATFAGAVAVSTLTANQAVYANGSSALTSIGAGTTTTVLHGNAAGAPTYGAVALTTDVSGTLPILNGGTNATAQTSTGVNYFDGTRITSGSVLNFNGTTTFGVTNAAASAVINIATSLSGSANSASLQLFRGDVTNGTAGIVFFNSGTAQWSIGLQTGDSSFYFHDVSTNTNRFILTQTGSVIVSSLSTNQAVYANSSKALTSIGAGTTTTVLHGNASGAPSYSAVSLSGDVSGTLPAGSGGTGTATAFTQGSVVFAGSSGIYTQNNSAFFYNPTGGPDSLSSLSIGSTSTTYTFNVQNTSTSDVALFQSSVNTPSGIVDILSPNTATSFTFTGIRMGIDTSSNFLRIGYFFSGSGSASNALAIQNSSGSISLFSVQNNGDTFLTGNFTLTGNGTKLRVSSTATNPSLGQVSLVGGTVTVTNTSVTANSRIFLSRKTTSGAVIGNLTYSIIATTSFTITSSSATETSSVNYLIMDSF